MFENLVLIIDKLKSFYVKVYSSQFTVFSMNYATIEAFWILISTLLYLLFSLTVNGYLFKLRPLL